MRANAHDLLSPMMRACATVSVTCSGQDLESALHNADAEQQQAWEKREHVFKWGCSDGGQRIVYSLAGVELLRAVIGLETTGPDLRPRVVHPLCHDIQCESQKHNCPPS